MIPRVMIVEDEPGTGQTLAKLFELWNWSPYQVRSIAEAVRGLEDAPHLVTLDLVLPDGDGIEVLRAIRTRPAASQPKVFVTTGKDPTALHDLLDLKPDQVLRKPFMPWVLEGFASAVWELAQASHPPADLWSGT